MDLRRRMQNEAVGVGGGVVIEDKFDDLFAQGRPWV